MLRKLLKVFFLYLLEIVGIIKLFLKINFKKDLPLFLLSAYFAFF